MTRPKGSCYLMLARPQWCGNQMPRSEGSINKHILFVIITVVSRAVVGGRVSLKQN